ncbi:CAP-Gly domain family protein [Candida parapsilosis]|uniref:CAP-Gly domain-containing protein n=2 Tax=Candida parapsilosis TaxID=5480 RepID=G8BIB9_CANPC|nr:uncharacterized protein CPAR2_401860 [Candida parapsilosis]KAF6047080.1 CAP-Gly domain family protein [Candida parapsilosis]KAF6047474.1 CAP-Gly domain family protein [Candida parapsilosis]KAF6050552.1 CAP-Gly domain family protein [Candida parapsilosis]KAF6061674.1 CAP-Gly domain family protein [Candida parapsilosis]KAI5901645.1 Protein PAC2 [Candida parapsilosis]
MTQYQLYDRVSTIDNYVATIKYIGHLPQWGSQVVAFGLEWDDANRGKNNGVLDGVQYFTPIVENSVSFVKSTNKNINHDRKSFIRVIREQYLDAIGYEAKGIKFGGKVVEELGWQQLNEYQSQLRNLTSLSLDHCFIYCMARGTEVDDVENVFAGLANLTNLDLSCNLFNNMDDIWQIVARLPNLKVLNINGNRFPLDVDNHEQKDHFIHYNLQVLKMASTLIPISKINTIVSQFPNLLELIISGNQYTNNDVNCLDVGDYRLATLDLSYNNLQCVPIKLPLYITTLNLSHCRINSIEKRVATNDITSLDIRYNQLKTWLDIDNLSESFTQLTNLRINHNPILNDLSIDDMTCQLIGRFECNNSDVHGENNHPNKLAVLNGSKLTPSEIMNGELYFISKVQSGQYEMHNRTRWEDLLKKYGKSDKELQVSPSLSQPKRWINLQLMVRQVKKQHMGNSESKTTMDTATQSINTPTDYTSLSTHKFLKTTSILKFKGLISRLFLSNLSILDFQIYYYINQDTNFAIKYEFDNWSSCLNDFALDEYQYIYIDVHQQ